MKVNDILELIRAGYTKADIEAMEAVKDAPAEVPAKPADDPKQAQPAQPAAEAQPAEAKADPVMEELKAEFEKEKIRIKHVKVGKGKEETKLEFDLIYPSRFDKNAFVMRWSGDSRVTAING